MDNVESNAPSQPGPGRSGALWFVLVCSVAALGVALVPCAGLLAQQGPLWLVVGAGLVVFPFLPLLWHGLAEIRPREPRGPLLSSASRFALRSLAVALVVLGVSLGDLGPKQVVHNVGALFGRLRAKPAAKPAPAPPPRAVSVPLVAAHGLEPFIPADATLVVGLAGSAAMEQLLAAHGVDTRDKLAALDTCKIDFVNARVLIAARGRGTHMIVVRAPGITDERNLYCLVGVMGRERLQIRPDGSQAAKLMHVSGLLSRSLTFRLLDQTTVIAIDDAWQDTAAQRLFAEGGTTAQGLLALPLQRVDRTAPLWVASVDETPQGTWDLALDSRQDGNMFKVKGSATPPSGEGDRAAISVSVPLAFARALPESAVALGIRGVVAAVVAIGASQSVPPALPAPVTPPAPAPAGGAP